jgi:hypothetical protein
MRVRPILIIFLSVFLMVSGLMNVQAAAKAGSKCQKSGVKAKVGGAELARNTLKIRLIDLLAITPLLISSQLSTSNARDGYYLF